MTKKITSQEEFDRYWNSHINEIIRRKIEFVINGHQKEILKFRKYWKIPQQGLTNRRAYNKWLRMQEDEFRNKPQLVYEQRAEFPIETNGLEIEIPEQFKFRKSQVLTIKISKGFIDYFRQRVLELGFEIGLDNTWPLVFENYLLFNILDMRLGYYFPTEISEKFYFSHQGKETARRISLIFGANTTLNGIKLAWKYQIEPLLKTLPGYIPHPPRKKKLSRH